MKDLVFQKSMQLFKEALEVLPAGVSSNARLWRKVCPTGMPCALFVEKADGSHIWDVDGNEYIDYRMGFGPVILGHSYAPVHGIVHRVDEHGLIFALSHEAEIRVARMVRSMVPCAEMIRFANSGTEATMHALRVARAYTGREKVVKMEGMYHGAHDYLLWSIEPPLGGTQSRPPRPEAASTGIPKALKDLVLVQRFNDFEGVERLFRRCGEEIAAVILEPVMGNCAAITPREGYLEHLKELCEAHGALLIFDEVKTGFRLAPGGAQEVYGVVPDMVTLAKSMGNGYPVAAFAGRREVMEIIGPQKVVHGGTYSSNPISMAATEATLKVLSLRETWKRLRRFGKDLMARLHEVLEERGEAHVINGHPTMFQILFTDQEEVREYRDLARCDLQRFTNLHMALLREGVMVDEDNTECWFTCLAHSTEDLEATAEAVREAVGHSPGRA
jgi:glutamate-1-semialdehyde 2,1-aminomutase